MTNHELEIIMKLRDEVSKRLEGIQGNLIKFSNSLEKAGHTLVSTGREISKVGTLLTTFGALITGPLFLAFKSADKYSGQVHDRLERLKNLTLAFQVQIANALIPVMDQVINTLGALWNAWNKLSPATQNAIIQGVAISGVFLTIGGIVTMLIGKFISLGGYLLKIAGQFLMWSSLNWPFALIAAAIAALIIITLKYKNVSTPVLNTIEVAAYAVAIGYEKVAKSIAMAIESMGAWSGNTALTQWGADQAQAIDVVISGLESRISKVFETGKGGLETGLEDTKKQISDLFALFKNPPKFDIKPISERLETLQEISHKIFTSMSSNMSDFFFNSIKEKSLKFVDFFQNLGNSILRIWTDVLAKMVTKWLEDMSTMQSGSGSTNWLSIIGNIAGIFSGVSTAGTNILNTGANAGIEAGFAGAGNAGYITAGPTLTSLLSGGMIRALGGLNIGPAERVVIGHTGERILSREESKEYSSGQGKGDFNFSPSFQVKATDAKSFMSHKKEIAAMVNDAVLKNTALRRTLMAYTKK